MQFNRPKLLFVSPCTPDKLGVGWEQRAYSLLLAYSQYMDVHLWFMPTLDSPNPERVIKIGNLCKTITAFKKDSFVNNHSTLRQFHEIVKQSNCIHVFRNLGFMNVKHPCIFWDMDELPAELRDKSNNINLQKVSDEKYDKALNKYSEAVKNKKCVFTSSYLEVSQSLGQIDYIPNVYSAEIDFYEKPPSNKIIFVGNTNFMPNVEAIYYFSKLVLPLLPPFVNFTVIGRGPIREDLKIMFDALKKNNRVNFIFDVESCEPFYRQAALAVVPINNGGGTKLKMLEAFGNFCPVVSTSKGCEGINVKDGEHIMVRDNPLDFAKACIEILGDPDFAVRIAKNANQLLKAEYSQGVVNELIRKKLEDFNFI